MNRREFIAGTSIIASSLALGAPASFAQSGFPVFHTAEGSL
jgi:hypothetical protein